MTAAVTLIQKVDGSHNIVCVNNYALAPVAEL